MDARSIDEVLAERVRSFRESQGLRQEDVAQRTEALGHPVSRVTLAKLESGGTRAANASLRDVLTLAHALDVPPVLLFLPLGEDNEVELLPGVVVHPQVALDWVSGEDDIRVANHRAGHIEAWDRNSQVLRLFNGLRLRHRAVGDAEAAGDAARFDRALRELKGFSAAMEAGGFRLPEIPESWRVGMDELAAED